MAKKGVSCKRVLCIYRTLLAAQKEQQGPQDSLPNIAYFEDAIHHLPRNVSHMYNYRRSPRYLMLGLGGDFEVQ